MITHRMATQPAPEPPTRLYKIIALGFLIVTIGLLAVIIFVTSKSATIVVQAKEDKEKVDVTVGVTAQNSDTTVRGTVTTSQFVWSEKYHVNGTKKVDGTATGKVIIYNKTDSAQPLVKTTRLLSTSGVLFRLTNGVNVPANGQVEADVYADKTGDASDIAPTTFTIPGLPETKQKVIYAESKEAMTGGITTAGVLTDDDVKKAEDDYKQKVLDTYTKNLPGTEQTLGRVFLVSNLTVKTDHKVGEEVGEFTVSGTSTIATVTYDANALADVLDKQVTSKVDTTAERYLPGNDSPEVVLGSVDAKNNTATLTVHDTITVTLDANVDKLAPRNFFGKSKEEIQRYILGLDHVAAVDVKFSPSWVLSAPTVPDKIKVVVKNM